MKYSFYHTLKIGSELITENVFNTSQEKEAIRIARTYHNNFEQNDNCRHSLKIDGEFRNIAELASKVVTMDAALETTRYKPRPKKKKQKNLCFN